MTLLRKYGPPAILFLALLTLCLGGCAGGRSQLKSPRLLPEGAQVSATCRGNTAQVTISGTTPQQIKQYCSGGIRSIANTTTFAQNTYTCGFRFNFIHGDSSYMSYSLLTPEMMGGHPSLGPGISVDCSNSMGCAYRITACSQ